MIEGQQRLNNSCYPEKAYKTGDEKKHFPCTYLGTGKVALCKDNTDDKENGELHQLEELESRNVVYQFYLSQQ